MGADEPLDLDAITEEVVRALETRRTPQYLWWIDGTARLLAVRQDWLQSSMEERHPGDLVGTYDPSSSYADIRADIEAHLAEDPARYSKTRDRRGS